MSKIEVNNFILWKIDPIVTAMVGDKKITDTHMEYGFVSAIDVDLKGTPKKGWCVTTSTCGLKEEVNYQDGLRTKEVVIVNHENLCSKASLIDLITSAAAARDKYLKNKKA